MANLDLYLTMPMPDRRRSEQPRGYKHFNTEYLSDFTIISGSLIFHKIRVFLFGGEL
jgi:hypothetical protein